MTELRDFEKKLRDDLAASAERMHPRPGAAEQAIAQAVGVRQTTLRRRGPSPWVLPALAAAVALILLSATVLVIQAAKGSRSERPTAPISGSPVPNSPTPSVNAVHAVTCQVPEPAQLTEAFHPVIVPTGPHTSSSTGHEILSATPDGDVVTTVSGSVPAQLDLVTPAGSVKTLYTTADIPLDQYSFAEIDSAQSDSNWLVFTASVAATGEQSPSRIGVVNRATSAVKIIRQLPAANKTIIIWPPVIFDGAVFWAEVDSSGTGSIFRYDPVAQETMTVATGTQLSNPTPVGGGLYWTADGHVTTYKSGRLPVGFQLDRRKLAAPVTDGTTSVWRETVGSPPNLQLQILLSRPGMVAPVVIYKGSADDLTTPLALSGPFVVWEDTSLVLLDTRTGATTSLSQGAPPQFDLAAAAGPTLAFDTIGAKGGPLLSIARTADLPELRC